MAKYIFAYHAGEMPKSPEEGAAHKRNWDAWSADNADVIVEPQNPLMHTKTVGAGGVEEGGGPNPIMGYSIVKAESIDEAVELAKSCPFVAMGTIEVAQLIEM